jgi:Spy/CpxP family protein refolding chaperone
MSFPSSLSVSGAANVASLSADSTDVVTSTSLRPFSKLNLTEAQRSQIRSILHTAKSQGLSKADVHKQIDGVLTADQKATLAAGQTNASSPSPSGPFASLNLTTDQKQKIDTILQSAKAQGTSHDQVRSQIDAVLTDAQKAQLQSYLQNGSASGSGPRPGDGDEQGSTSATSTTSSTSAADLQQQALSALSILTKYIQSQLATS